MAKEEMRRRDESGLGTRQYQDPISMLDAMFERMQRDLFGASLLSAFGPGRGGDEAGGRPTRIPRVQMRETDDALEVTAELPGIDGKDVKVECHGDVLTISGEAHTQAEREGGRMERSTSFYRQIPLPGGVDPQQAQASYRNGVLSIRFPSRAQRESARQIPVSTEPTKPGKAA